VHKDLADYIGTCIYETTWLA